MGKRTQNIIVLFLSVFVIAGTVGYAMFSASLANTKTIVTTDASRWNVHFKNGSYTTLNTSTIDVENTPNLTDPSLSTKLNVKIGNGDIFDCVLAIENEGSIDAIIEGITLSGDTTGLNYSFSWYGREFTKETYPVQFVESPIEFSKDVLKSNTIRNIKIHIEGTEDVENTDRNISVKFDFSR